MRKTRTTNRQDAENGPLRRSHFARSLDVHKEYASGSRSLRPSNELVLSILPKPQIFAHCDLAGWSFEQLPRFAVLYLKRSRIVLSEIRTMLHPSRTSGRTTWLELLKSSSGGFDRVVDIAG